MRSTGLRNVLRGGLLFGCAGCWLVRHDGKVADSWEWRKWSTAFSEKDDLKRTTEQHKEWYVVGSWAEEQLERLEVVQSKISGNCWRGKLDESGVGLD